MLIISLLAGLVTLSPLAGGPGRQLDTELDRLYKLISLARDRALLEDRELGLSLTGDAGYRWWQWSEDQEQWQPLQDAGFRDYQLPPALAVTSLGETVTSSAFTQEEETREGPEWVFYTDTSMTPFHLELSVREGALQVGAIRSDGIAAAERL